MIVKSEAVLPKAGSATSVYPAVILRVTESSSQSAFVTLQVFCPDVMSGDVTDAKYAGNNYIQAPRGPHDGVTYDFQIGGIVMISYQNGNIDSPQFVRYVPIDPDIISLNAQYVSGIKITATDEIFNIGSDNVTLDTPGLQKGVALLGALKACANSSSIFHTFGYDDYGPGTVLDGHQYLTIYRCGKYGQELVYKSKIGWNFTYGDDSLEYLTDHGENFWLDIIKNMFNRESDTTPDQCLVDVVNAAIIKFESESNYKKAIYDRTNPADRLFWYSQLAGLVYYPTDGNFDKSVQISAALSSEIADEGYEVSQPEEDSKLYAVLHNFDEFVMPGVAARTIYRSRLRTDGYVKGDKDSQVELRNNVFDFITKLYNELNSNEFFDEIIGANYAAILSNNLLRFRQTYKADSLTNKMLMIITVIASAYPVLQNVILNFELDTDQLTDSMNQFNDEIMSCLSNSSKQLPSNSDIAAHFTDMYFHILEWPVTHEKDEHSLFKYDSEPGQLIYEQMLRGLNYIDNNYDTISGKLDDNTSEEVGGDSQTQSKYGFVWPCPDFSTITSPFGPRGSGYHYGVDISGSCYGKDIIAAKAGKVVACVTKYSANQTGSSLGYGNYIKIEHNDGFSTVYAHLLSASVKLNQQVSQGQVIGKCDNTGNSTGSHLHFEIILNGVKKNPLDYVSASDKYTPPVSSGGVATGDYYDVPLSEDIQDYLFETCNKYNVPVALMLGLIEAESSFNPNAVSSAGAVGLCQIMPSNYDWLHETLGITSLSDPKQNILCGVYILSMHMKNYGTDTAGLHKSLMAYNMGAGGASKLWATGKYQSSYSIKVMANYNKYKR